MPKYKVLKNFPSRNGAREYKEGDWVTLSENQRTKALVEMGYIEIQGRDLLPLVLWGVKRIGCVRRISLKRTGTKGRTQLFNLEVEAE